MKILKAFKRPYISYNYAPFEEEGTYRFAAVGRSVCRSVRDNSFRSISLEWVHILKWNFVYRNIKWKSRSSSYLGPIEKILTELCPLNFGRKNNYISIQYPWKVIHMSAVKIKVFVNKDSAKLWCIEVFGKLILPEMRFLRCSFSICQW